MEVLITFGSLLASYVTNFYPFLVIHSLLLAWFWSVSSRGLRRFRFESEVLQRLEGAEAEQMDNIVAEFEGRSRVARTLQAVLSTARTMSTVDVGAKTAGVSEPLRQGVATGTTIANLFLISGVLGTLVGMYQGAEAATAGDSPLASTLSGAFHAFGVTVVAILCAGFVLLVANRLRQRAVRFQEMVAFQAERFLLLHKGELGGELARHVSQTMNEMKDLFKTQSKRFEDAEDVFRKALESLAALLAHFGGFQEVTAQMAKSVADLRKMVNTASSKMSEAMEKSVNAQKEALETGLSALQESWKHGLDAQNAILREFTRAIETTLREAASKHQAATSEAAQALAEATSSSASMIANAQKAAEEMIDRSAQSYVSTLDQFRASVRLVATHVEDLDKSFAEVARKAGEVFGTALGNIEYQMRQLVEQAKEQTANLSSTWNERMDKIEAMIKYVIQTETHAFVEAVSKETTVMTKHFSDSLDTLEKQITTATALVENVARRLDAAQRGTMAPRPVGPPTEPSGVLANRNETALPRLAPDVAQRDERGLRPVSPMASVGRPASMGASPELQREQERSRVAANPQKRQPNAPTQVYDAASAAVRSDPLLPRRKEGPAGIPHVRSAPPSGKQDARTPVSVVPEPAAPQFQETPVSERRLITSSQQPSTPPTLKKDLSGGEQEGPLVDAGHVQGGAQEDTKARLWRRIVRSFRWNK